MARFLVVALRQRPKDVFLTPGNLRAPTSVRLPGMRRPLSWAVMGTIATILLAAGFATQQWPESGGSWRRIPAAAAAGAAGGGNGSPQRLRGGGHLPGRAAGLSLPGSWAQPGGPDDLGVVRAGALYYDAIPPGPIGAIQAGALALLLGTVW